MRIHLFGISLIVGFFCVGIGQSYADTGRYRIMWRDDPSTSMVIGWDQYSGNGAIVYYDTKSHGRTPTAYRFKNKVDKAHAAKGMNNRYARLSNLQPNTVYYFVIKDSEGVSPVFSFQTIPDIPTEKLSIIAGGDSRNHRAARCLANSLVGKLRPHFIIFDGDMTNNDSARDWQMWLDDWQQTISPDGRLFPIVVAQGNHEQSPQSLIDIFDLKASKAYYGLNFGGTLLRLYTLNSEMAPNGDQLDWLANDLHQNRKIFTWTFAQYHRAIRPHTLDKKPMN
ncbi:MAG: metallophosphoesterase family protein, partial [Bacteroidota bacterium]